MLSDALTGPAALESLMARADELAASSRSDRTIKLYAADWAEFVSWCRMSGALALPAAPNTVALYLTHLSVQVTADGRPRLKPSSIVRRIAAIAAAHRDAGLDSPTATDRVRRVMSGIRRTGDATVRRKWPLLTDDISRMVTGMEHGTWPAGVKSARDTLALLMGFAGALRRSSVAALTVGDVSSSPDGLLIRIRQSKTDQDGVGRSIVLPFGASPITCPVCAWVRWSQILDAVDGGSDSMGLVIGNPEPENWGHVCSNLRDDPFHPDRPVFRRVTKAGALGSAALSSDALYRAVKDRARTVGLKEDRYGFHSLRAGFVTQARRNGASAREVRLQTMHASDRMVDVYDREYDPLAGGNAVLKLGL
ncbi:hypothetical protein [Microbacterium enclense]|uniref:hypothetical protein n=1 Tax=Microbacterium enclense TaxID=993073 RepID=UPI003F7F7799